MESEQADRISRRDFLKSVGAAGGAAVTPVREGCWAQTRPPDYLRMNRNESEKSGLLAAMRPQQNAHRNLMDLSGFWQFQLDPKGEGEQSNWKDGLPSPRVIPVPASWNDLFDDAANYLGYAWYAHEAWVPKAWQGQRIFLRVYSANYAAKVWLNGTLLGEHVGGHLPFAFEVSAQARLDAPNRIVIRVENLQKPDRVPPANPTGRRGSSTVFLKRPMISSLTQAFTARWRYTPARRHTWKTSLSLLRSTVRMASLRWLRRQATNGTATGGP